jgi:hypothetical protein
MPPPIREDLPLPPPIPPIPPRKSSAPPPPPAPEKNALEYGQLMYLDSGDGVGSLEDVIRVMEVEAATSTTRESTEPSPWSTTASALEALFAHLIIHLSLVGIRQDLISLADLLELFLGCRAFVSWVLV